MKEEKVIERIKKEFPDMIPSSGFDHLDELMGLLRVTRWQRDQAEKELSALRKELEAVKARFQQYLEDTSNDLECLSTCNPDTHDESCPVVNPQAAWRKLREELEAERSKVERLASKLKGIRIYLVDHLSEVHNEIGRKNKGNQSAYILLMWKNGIVLIQIRSR